MTVETAIWHVLVAGARLDVDGDNLILDVPDEGTAARVRPEAVAVLRACKAEALGIVRRMRDRAAVDVECVCACCGEPFTLGSPGATWIPCPDDGSWPRCATCTARGRVHEVPQPAARPRRSARGG